MQIESSIEIRHAISTIRTSGHLKKCKPNRASNKVWLLLWKSKFSQPLSSPFFNKRHVLFKHTLSGINISGPGLLISLALKSYVCPDVQPLHGLSSTNLACVLSWFQSYCAMAGCFIDSFVVLSKNIINSSEASRPPFKSAAKQKHYLPLFT